MEYTFRTDETPGRAVRRIAAEQLALAVADLSAGSIPVSIRVHEYRKRAKKLRALLRLVRSEVAPARAALRDCGELGRRFCSARDARIVFDLAALQFSGTCGPRLRRHFQTVCEETEASALAAFPGARRKTAAGLRKVERWDTRRVTVETAAAGFARTLKRARKALAAAQDTRTPAAFHELRKRCKDHWYHLCLLADALPERMRPRIRRLDSLCGLLGLSQDYSVLLERLDDLPAALAGSRDAARLRRVAGDERKRLHAEILVSAASLLEVDPERLAARLASQWRKRRAQKKPRTRRGSKNHKIRN